MAKKARTHEDGCPALLDTHPESIPVKGCTGCKEVRAARKPTNTRKDRQKAPAKEAMKLVSIRLPERYREECRELALGMDLLYQPFLRFALSTGLHYLRHEGKFWLDQPEWRELEELQRKGRIAKAHTPVESTEEGAPPPVRRVFDPEATKGKVYIPTSTTAEEMRTIANLEMERAQGLLDALEGKQPTPPVTFHGTTDMTGDSTLEAVLDSLIEENHEPTNGNGHSVHTPVVIKASELVVTLVEDTTDPAPEEMDDDLKSLLEQL